MITIERHWVRAHRAHPDLRTAAAASASSEFCSGSPVVVAERHKALVRSAVSALPNPDDRLYRLLAMPFFGTTGGGAGNHLVAALRAILDAATELAARYGVDLVLVLRDKAAFSLA
jgi:hypothetical protein